MKDLQQKYLGRLRKYFLAIGILGYIFMFTIGVVFFLMDVTAKLYQFLLILLIPTIYLITGLIAKFRNVLVWILMFVISILQIVSAIPPVIEFIPMLPFSIIMMLTFHPVLWFIIFGIIILVYLFQPEILKYYFGK